MESAAGRGFTGKKRGCRKGQQDRVGSVPKRSWGSYKQGHVTLQRSLWARGRGASRGKATIDAPEAEPTHGAPHPSRHTPFREAGLQKQNKTTANKQTNDRVSDSQGSQQPEPGRPGAHTFSPPERGDLSKVEMESENLAKWSRRQ